MSYEIGTSISLTHLNKEVAPIAARKSFAEHLQEVGSSYRFDKTLKAFKQIPVSFA